MPWQRLVADVGLELLPTGLLAYREVWFTIHRQGGKTTLLLPFEVDRCLSWDRPQRVAYTAQTGFDARRKLLDDQVPVLEASPLRSAVQKVSRVNGSEGVLFRNSSRIDVLASTGSAGHGRTVDLGVLDEAWKDVDDRREQALLPAMVTRPMAQLLGASTQGTDASTYLNRKVEIGRAATVEDSGQGVAYFEWSFPDDADIDDPETWWRYMPALGYTISEAAVAHARQTMEEGEFRRAFGNQRTSSGEREIPADMWDATLDPSAQPAGTLTFGLDVNHDRSSGAIVVCDGTHAELLEHRSGTGWLVPRALDLLKTHGGEIVVDGGGPAAPIADELEAERSKVRRVTGGDLAAACARIYDAIADRKILIRPSQPLDDAAAGVTRKPLGDRFVWSRSTSSVDVTPLMALTLSYAHGQQEVKPFVLLG